MDQLSFFTRSLIFGAPEGAAVLEVGDIIPSSRPVIGGLVARGDMACDGGRKGPPERFELPGNKSVVLAPGENPRAPNPVAGGDNADPDGELAVADKGADEPPAFASENLGHLRFVSMS